MSCMHVVDQLLGDQQLQLVDQQLVDQLLVDQLLADQAGWLASPRPAGLKVLPAYRLPSVHECQLITFGLPDMAPCRHIRFAASLVPA